MRNPADVCGFGSARFRVILATWALDPPIPVGAPVGEWVHLPYGPSVWTTDGTRQVATWTVPIMLVDASDYTALRQVLGTIGSLSTPFGGRVALLRDMSGLQFHPASGTYRGPVTWEWPE